MNQKNKIVEVYGLWFADLVTIVVSFILATYIRFGNFRDMGDKAVHFQVCLVYLLCCTIYTFFIDWNRNFIKRSIKREAYEIFKYNIILILVVQTVMTFLKWADVFSRIVTVYFAVINVFLTLFIHLLVKKGMHIHYSSELSKIKVLVITQKAMLEDVLKHLKEHLGIHYQIIGIACTEQVDFNHANDIPVMYIDDKFMENVTLMTLDEVFIYAPELKQSQIQMMINGFDVMGVDTHYCMELPGMNAERSKVDDFGGYSVLTYTRFRSSYKRLLIKRVMDIVGGLIGMLITLIFFPFVAIAIKLDSPGPVLFSQVRIGRNGRRFKIYKFRSMYMDAEERKKELEEQNEIQGLMFKIEKGDMSLVGTRPPTEDEFEKYNQYYRRRISMTPGLTGLWQVSGRSDIEDFDDVVKYDLKYIDGWSLTLDVKILFRTVWVVIAGRGSK